MAHHSTQSSHKTGQLNVCPDSFEDSHVREPDFLQSANNFSIAGPTIDDTGEREGQTLINSSFVYSGMLGIWSAQPE